MSVVDISAMDQLANENQKVQAADLLFAEVGFTDEEIQLMKDEQKLKTLDGLEWGVTRAVGQSYDSDLQNCNTWSSSLSYTRQNMTDYMFANFSFNMLPVQTWSQSIAVQGFALDFDTAKLEYQCIPIVNGVEQWPIRGVYTKANDNSNDDFQFDYTSEYGSSGCAFTYEFNPFAFSDADGMYYRMEVEGSVSNINLPVNGQTGGSFNVYGNLRRIHGYNVAVSFSIPWGVSVSQGNLNITDCKTSLFATLYAD